MTPKEIIKMIKWEPYPPYNTGGQSCGMIHTGCTQEYCVIYRK